MITKATPQHPFNLGFGSTLVMACVAGHRYPDGLSTQTLICSEDNQWRSTGEQEFTECLSIIYKSINYILEINI